MKNFSPLVMFLVCSYVAFAQTPEKMSYQAIVRDANNTLLVDKLVGIQVSILQNSETGLEVYIETHSVVTNMNGLVVLEIGMGVTSYDFSSLDWTNGPYFVKIETDPNGADNYTISGVSQLMSVPFALYAKASGNGITTSQADAIVTNTAKTGITSDQADAIVGNTAKTGITSDQADAIVTNTAKTGITSDQADAIVANTAKTGITSDQSDAIVANTAKTGITSDQSDAIVANTAKTGITSDQSDAIVANTSKTGITSDQADAIVANTTKTGITSDQSDAIVTNTAKTGITSDQSDAIVTNTTKTGITTDQADAIVANTAKTGITSDQADAIVANTAKTGITSDQSDAIVANTAKTGITSDQADAIVANTAKTSITTDQTDAIVANTAKTSITTDQTDAIVANTAKTGITTDQTDAIVVNTAKISLPSGGNEDDILKIINGEYVWVGEPTYQLNTFYSKLGGYVIDINSDGTHGLVVAMQDQGFGNWYDATNKINDPDNHDSDGGKFRDWRLPSKRELILIYQVYLNSNPLDLLSTTYWSSTEFNYLKAWCHVISSNSKYYDSKYGATFDIRAVRSF